MMSVVDDTARKITDMSIRGAGRIARAGASARGDFARTYEGKSLEGFLADLDTTVDTLVASRPTAVSLWNGVHAAL